MALDSLSLREFLGLGLTDRVPDHSSLSRIRSRLPLEVQMEIFRFVLKLLATEKLLSGKHIGIDATTLEANAAMRSIVRRDTGESYTEFLTALAKESGIDTPTKEDLARLDRSRKNKGSNDDWQSPADPDSGIAKMGEYPEGPADACGGVQPWSCDEEVNGKRYAARAVGAQESACDRTTKPFHEVFRRDGLDFRR